MISGPSRYFFLQIGIPLSLGIVALFIPLLRDLHFESAMVASVLGCFAAAYVATRAREPISEAANLLRVLSWVYLPAVVLLLVTLIRGCFSADGLLYWLFNPSLSVLFGYAIGRYFRVNGFKKPLRWANLVLVIVAVGIFLFEFFTLPQLYFFNHVWGHWPGPIYDEEVQFTTSVVVFRFITLCWVGVFWLMPHFKDRKQAQYLIFLFFGGLVLSYLRLSESGIISPNEYIETRLGGQLQTEYADVYYASDRIAEYDINRIAALNDFHISELRDTLKIDSEDRVSAYIYAHGWQKKRLTGAKFTSYVPVWTSRHQYHINRQAVDGSLRHELVHVLGKDFGNRLLNASWSIGLVEGLAVALSPAEQREATVDQMVKANEAWLEPDELEKLFSVTGFYRQAGPMSYTIAGSFVQYLLQNYPVEKFKEAYRRSSISAGYETPLDSLQAGWKQHLQTIELDQQERRAGLQAFAVPSIFDQDCPRQVTGYQAALDRSRFHLAERDTASALRALEQAMESEPNEPRVVRHKMDLLAQQQRWEEVVEMDIPDSTRWLSSLFTYADGLRSSGRQQQAEEMLQDLDSLANEASSHRNEVSMRASHWDDLLLVTYNSAEVRLDHADRLSLTLQWIWLSQLHQQGHFDKLIEFASSLQPRYHPAFHRQFLLISEYLATNGFSDTALNWLQTVNPDQMRPALRHQFEQTLRFAEYMVDQPDIQL